MGRTASSTMRKELKEAIFQRDGYRCVYCKRADMPLTVDHIRPRSKGGPDSPTNLVTACDSCNQKKMDKKLDAYAGRKAQRRVKHFVRQPVAWVGKTKRWKAE